MTSVRCSRHIMAMPSSQKTLPSAFCFLPSLNMPSRSQIVLLGVVITTALISHFSGSFNDYFLDVAIGVGINIILAVSLNLINGYTGQFSLGHAGFMAVGAYSAAVVTTNFGKNLLPLLGGQAWLLFLLALLARGLFAAPAGLAG